MITQLYETRSVSLGGAQGENFFVTWKPKKTITKVCLGLGFRFPANSQIF